MPCYARRVGLLLAARRHPFRQALWYSSFLARSDAAPCAAMLRRAHAAQRRAALPPLPMISVHTRRGALSR